MFPIQKHDEGGVRYMMEEGVAMIDYIFPDLKELSSLTYRKNDPFNGACTSYSFSFQLTMSFCNENRGRS